MTLFELLYPSERKACKEADIRNCHFHDLTIQELSTIRYKNLIEFSFQDERFFLSNAAVTLTELYCRINAYTQDNKYFFNEKQTTKEG